MHEMKKKWLDNFKMEIKDKIWIQNSLVLKVYELNMSKETVKIAT